MKTCWQVFFSSNSMDNFYFSSRSSVFFDFLQGTRIKNKKGKREKKEKRKRGKRRREREGGKEGRRKGRRKEEGERKQEKSP